MNDWLSKNWRRLLWWSPVCITVVSWLQRAITGYSVVVDSLLSLLILLIVGALLRGYFFFLAERYAHYYQTTPFRAVFYMIGPAVLTLVINIGNIKPLLLEGVSMALLYTTTALLGSVAIRQWSISTGRRDGYSLIATVNSLLYTISIIAVVALCTVALLLPLQFIIANTALVSI